MPATRASEFRLSFWPLQLGGWFLYAVAIATSNLPLRHEKELVAFRMAFLLVTFLVSFPMYWLCKALRLRRIPVLPSIAICLAVCAVLGFGCSAAAVWSEIFFGGSQAPFQWSSALSNMTGGAFVLVAWCAIYSGIKQYQALEQEKERLSAAEASAREAQLLALRYQLQPHFLFNTLNAISSLVVDDQPQLATRMIARLGDLLRSTLDRPDVHFVSLADEIVVVKEYLSIEEARFGTRLRVVFDMPADALAASVPRFLLQPLVENAIRHGISHLPAGGTISLRAARMSDDLEVQVENDLGTNRWSASDKGGLGIANTQERLRQVYGDEASVKGQEVPATKTFLIVLRFPAAPPRQSRGVSL